MKTVQTTKSVKSSFQNGKANQTASALGALIADVGDTIGNYDVDKRDTCESVEDIIVECLSLAMEEYALTADMLRAPSKERTGELYTILVDAMNVPSIARAERKLGKDASEFTADEMAQAIIDVRRRDNYMSKIRKFVENRGALPLDLNNALYNAAKRDLAKKEKAGTVKTDAAETPAKSVQFTAKTEETEQPKGLQALRDLLSTWIPANDEPGASPEMEMVLGLADDLLQEVKKIIAKREPVKFDVVKCNDGSQKVIPAGLSQREQKAQRKVKNQKAGRPTPLSIDQII